MGLIKERRGVFEGVKVVARYQQIKSCKGRVEGKLAYGKYHEEGRVWTSGLDRLLDRRWSFMREVSEAIQGG